MTIRIEKSLLQQMIQTNIQHNQIMSQILASLDQHEEWVETSKAEELSGIPASRIRYLYRSGQVEGRKRGQKKIEILLGDLQSFTNKEAKIEGPPGGVIPRDQGNEEQALHKVYA